LYTELFYAIISIILSIQLLLKKSQQTAISSTTELCLIPVYIGCHVTVLCTCI